MGLSFYTLGQRQGLGIGGVNWARQTPKAKGRRGAAPPPPPPPTPATAEHQPWFVARKEVAQNTLRVVQGHDHPWLLSHSLGATDCSWVAGHAPAAGALAAKSRYRQADAACTLAARNDGGFSLQFEQAQWAVTPGQSAVLYDGEVCLGGGVIDSASALPG
jgi:tRNA-specific 2-thiouridylase